MSNASIGGGAQAPSWKEDPAGAFSEASKLKFFPKAPRQLLLRLHELMKGLVGVLRTICLQVIAGPPWENPRSGCIACLEDSI